MRQAEEMAKNTDPSFTAESCKKKHHKKPLQGTNLELGTATVYILNTNDRTHV